MHQLIKFFSKRNYAEQFLKGNLYMNSLGFFWDNGFDSQKDLFEGISETFDKKSLGFPITMWQLVDGDIMFQLNAYRYCNLYCFYRIDIEECGFCTPVGAVGNVPMKAIHLPGKEMTEFGNTVAIIKNETAFMKRVIKALEENWLCIAGDVRYHQFEGSKNGTGGNVCWKSTKMFPAPKLEKENGRTSTKDCFDKTIFYSNQREWRICLFRNRKDDEAYTLKIGDLSDIVELIAASQLEKRLLEMHKPCFSADVVPQYSSFIGNIKRSEFKKEMYQFDNAMGYFVMTT